MLALFVSRSRSACLLHWLIRRSHDTSHYVLFPLMQNRTSICQGAMSRFLKDLLVYASAPVALIKPVFLRVIVINILNPIGSCSNLLGSLTADCLWSNTLSMLYRSAIELLLLMIRIELWHTSVWLIDQAGSEDLLKTDIERSRLFEWLLRTRINRPVLLFPLMMRSRRLLKRVSELSQQQVLLAYLLWPT